MQDTFSYRHISRWIREQLPQNREALIESLTWESNARRLDPLRGSHGVAINMHHQIIDLQTNIANLNLHLQAAHATNLQLQAHNQHLQAENAALIAAANQAAAQAQALANNQHIQDENAANQAAQ
ncbi:hypothetical protein A2U01_0047780, partial [Trifolium medium]|nr:hypothetical protein [Trifolium medium]